MKTVIRLGRQLDAALGSRAKVAVLRVLHDGRPELNGREVARRGGMALRSAQLALHDLTRQGVLRMRALGNNNAYSLNPAFHLVGPALAAIFEAERNAAREMVSELLRALRAEAVVSAGWFGSAARGVRGSGSDLDFFVILKDPCRPERTREELRARAPALQEAFGVRVEPYVLGLGELARRFDSGDPLARNLVRDAVILRGKPLSEALSDAA